MQGVKSGHPGLEFVQTEMFHGRGAEAWGLDGEGHFRVGSMRSSDEEADARLAVLISVSYWPCC